MKKIYLLLASLVALAGCASQSTPQYITTCTEPVCSSIAKKVEHAYQEIEGVVFISNASLKLTISEPITKVIQQNDTNIFLLEDDRRIAIGLQSIDSLGLSDKKTTLADFMDWVFLKDFKSLEEIAPKDDILMSVRGFKLLSSELMTPSYFIRGHLKVFYYLTDERNFQAIIIDNRRKHTAIMVDAYSFNQDEFEKLISTMSVFENKE